MKQIAMKKYIILLLFSVLSFNANSQEMTVTKLGEIFTKVSDTIVTNNSRWRFVIKDIPFMAIADSTHNRMRIMSPIKETSQLSEELKTACLIANFHTALDIKYAITDGILWSAFIHPLKELSEGQVVDAISQVYYGHVNFGTTFSSGSLVFPGRNQSEKVKEEEIRDKILEKI